MSAAAAAVEREYVSVERELVQRTSRGRIVARYVVKAYSIASTSIVVFQAFEPTRRSFCDFSHVARSPEFGDLGLYTSRALPPEIDGLPLGEERTRACAEHFAIRAGDACDLIAAAFPELKGCWEPKLTRGEMWCDLADFHARVSPT